MTLPSVSDQSGPQVAVAFEVGDQQRQAAGRIGRLLPVVDGVARNAAADRHGGLHLGIDLGDGVPIGERAAGEKAQQQRGEDRDEQAIAQRQAEYLSCRTGTL